MRRHTPALAACSLLLLLCAACSQNQTTANQAPVPPQGSNAPAAASKTPPADVVRVRVEDVRLKAGGSAEASVRLAIADGYHINGNPASKFQIATSVEVVPGDGITAGQPQYPPSVSKKFSFSDQPIAVYEGEPVIRLPLNAAATAQKGAHTLKAKLRIQACDDEVCFPPRNMETSIPVTIE
ncbi:MAG TPA: protein-disulfide reductase DsbD N-terminal domain-containing protein [Pyrinomonadaceae bacterium]|jgi:thiol:disulfide interchange protein DsbD